MDNKKYPRIAKFLETELTYYFDDYPKDQADIVRRAYFDAVSEFQECIRELVGAESIAMGVDSIEIKFTLPSNSFTVISNLEVRNAFGSINDGTDKEAIPTVYTPIGELTGGLLEYLISNQDSPVTAFLYHLYSGVVWLQLEMEKAGVLAPHTYTYNLVQGCCIEDPLMLFAYVVDYAGLKDLLGNPESC